MSRAKRAFEDLLSGAGPAPSRDRGTTRDEMRRWFDQQPPHHRVAGRSRHDCTVARLLVRGAVGQKFGAPG